MKCKCLKGYTNQGYANQKNNLLQFNELLLICVYFSSPAESNTEYVFNAFLLPFNGLIAGVLSCTDETPRE